MRELDLTTSESNALFFGGWGGGDELAPLPLCFLQLVGKRYLSKLFAHQGKENERAKKKKKKERERERREKQANKKIIPFRQNILGSIRRFPKRNQFFVLGEMSIPWESLRGVSLDLQILESTGLWIYRHASPINSVRQQPNVEEVVKSENTLVISLIHVKKKYKKIKSKK